MTSALRGLMLTPPRALSRGVSGMEDGMLRTDRWSTSTTRVEVDQRSRATRLRLEQLERLLSPPSHQTRPWFLRVLGWRGFGMIGGERRQGRATRARVAGRRSRNTRAPADGGILVGSCRVLAH
jgi:hypothetical protein